MRVKSRNSSKLLILGMKLLNNSFKFFAGFRDVDLITKIVPDDTKSDIKDIDSVAFAWWSSLDVDTLYESESDKQTEISSLASPDHFSSDDSSSYDSGNDRRARRVREEPKVELCLSSSYKRPKVNESVR